MNGRSRGRAGVAGVFRGGRTARAQWVPWADAIAGLALAVILSNGTPVQAGGTRTPALPPYLFDSGTPATDPGDLCGDCYAWTSTYLHSAGNFDLSARRIVVPSGAYARALRFWWAYGEEGPFDPIRNRGGTAADFQRIVVDLYADSPSGGPGPWIASLEGNWHLLNADTHYRELELDQPFVFADSVYWMSLRAETSRPDYGAVILWLGCAPDDDTVDYLWAQNGFWASGGWDPYTEDNIPYSPCPRDTDLGLQVLGFLVPDGVDAVPLEPCLTSGCGTVSIDFHRVDPTPVRGYSLTLHLGPELLLCAGPDSVEEGTYLSRVGPTSFQFRSLGAGVYQVDAALLGWPCGATGVGNLLTLRVRRDPLAPPEGTATIAVTSVIARDCQNQPVPAQPGAPAVVAFDVSAPEPVAGFLACQVLEGNNPPPPDPPRQVTAIELEFVPPPAGVEVMVYRASYGNYPEYDDPPLPGSVPSVPAWPPPWPWTVVSGLSGAGGVDRPQSRDVWYYVAFARDACGNVSSGCLAENPRRPVAGPGTLNYHLGDVSKGHPPVCSGNNRVGLEDISLLGDHYGVTESDPLYLDCVDVGPTDDGSPHSRPSTDNQIDLEDLMIFAMNFGEVDLRGGGTVAAPGGGAAAALRLALVPAGPGLPPDAGVCEFALLLDQRPGSVKGIHARIEVDPRTWKLERIDHGKLIPSTAEPCFFKAILAGDGCIVDAAVLGADRVFPGAGGEVARLRFRRVTAAGPSPRLVAASLRDGGNRPVGVAPADDEARGVADLEDEDGGAGAGSGTGTVQSPSALSVTAVPNPFRGSTTISLVSPAPGLFDVRIHDVGGRLVRRLPAVQVDAGPRCFAWDGRRDDGRLASPGVYFLTVRGPEESLTRKIQLR